MASTQQHLRQIYRAARRLAAQARLPADARLHKAALRAEFSGEWDGACALWFEQRSSLIEMGAPHAKAGKRLAHCALKSAREAEATGRWQAALQSWDYLRAVEPVSDVAAKGIERCAQHLAAAGDALDDISLKYPLRTIPQYWKVDVLLRLGKARKACESLSALESDLGRSAASRRLRALIALHFGQFAQAADAAREAAMLLQQAGASQQRICECLHIQAEALCAQDLHAEARKVLFAHLHDFDALTDRDFGALFSTARTREDIEAVRAFLEPNFAAGHKSRRSALKQHSVALRDLGFAADAIAVARTRLLEGLAARNFGDAPRKANGEWSRGAARALLDLKTDLDAGNFPFFLISGTLLGCVRDGYVIEHDKDIDVGVPAGVNLAAMSAYLQSTGRFRARPLPVDTVVRMIHANGTSIDLFRHWPEEGRTIHQGQKTQWWNTPFTLRPQDFLGTTFQVPHDAELYLSENYGDWKTPAKDFDTVADTPNMIAADREHLIWYCLTWLHDYHVWGKRAQFAKLWAALQAMTRVDAEISSRVAGQLAALGGGSESKGRST